MKRNFIYSLAATFITAALTLGSLTACSNEDLVSNTNNTQAKTYTVSIPASMGEDGTTRAVDFSGTDLVSGKPTAISSFTASDKIYVYNQSEGAMLGDYLQPTNISADGKTCDLTGSLTGDIAAGDNLVLLYNLSNFDSTDKGNCYFFYDHQNGTQAGVIDGAKATVTASVDDDNLTTATANFQNVQSMFRFQFASNGTPLSVKSVDITSQKHAIASAYFPCDNIYVIGGGSANLPSTTTDPIYVAMCIDESKSAGDVLTFNVVDADNKLYTTTKAAPNSGFVNGKYYYNSSAIDLGDYKLQLVKPTLSRSDGGYDSELADASFGRAFEIYSPSQSGAGTATGIAVSISGTSRGYNFILDSNASDASHTVSISGLTATVDENAYYIYSRKSLTLNISGANTINCNNTYYCVVADNDLKLSGNGTLTVTANSSTDYGLWGDNYKSYGSISPSNLAADGYTVTRSATQNNGDGTYTWTYTVAPDPGKPLTLKAIQAGSVTVSSSGVPNLTYPITYKINGGAAQNVVYGNEISLNADDEISFYSTNAALATSESDYIRIRPAMPCYVYGNVMSLIDDSGNGFATDKTISSDYALCQLFNIASNLRNHPSLPLLLPATTLTTGCYYNMFFGCSGLTTAPSLPAETMATSCYRSMFAGCTSLTAAPSLPAETMATSCYSGMFTGCTSLTAAPELKATSLANNCYNNMFLGCTSLTVAPELKATTLAEYCYCGMFQSCTNLSVAPELKATTLANYCCSNMFRYCTNLTVAPELKAATLVNNCYSNMFYGCTNLTVAPELKATTLVSSCYNSMFYGCTKLASVKCLAKSGLDDGNCIQWLHGVAASGTFTKSSYPFAYWPTGESGIPTGWNVQEE